MGFLGDGRGAGKPTGETPGESLVAGPRAGAVRLRELAVAVSSDYHRARLSAAYMGGTQRGKVASPQ